MADRQKIYWGLVNLLMKCLLIFLIELYYEIINFLMICLCSGTFGIVRRGFKDGKEYAIKMILKEEIRKNVGWEGIVQKEI